MCYLAKSFIITWCRRPDLNRHGFPHYPLKIACLPSSTTSAQIGARPGCSYSVLAGVPGVSAGISTGISVCGRACSSIGGLWSVMMEPLVR